MAHIMNQRKANDRKSMMAQYVERRGRFYAGSIWTDSAFVTPQQYRIASSPPGLSHKITHGGSTRWAWSKSNCKISFVWERQPETLMSGFFPMEFQEFTKYHREVASNATIQVARWHQRCFGQHDRGQQSKSADGSLCLLLSIVSAWMSHRH